MIRSTSRRDGTGATSPLCLHGDPRDRHRREDSWGTWARTLLSALPRGVEGLRILELCAADSRTAWYVQASLGGAMTDYRVTHPAFAQDRRLGAAVRRVLAHGHTGGTAFSRQHPPKAASPAPVRQPLRGACVHPERLPYDDRTVDVVCGFDVLGRCDDPASAAAEISRVARRRVVLLERNGLNLRRLLKAWSGQTRVRDLHPPWRLLAWFPRGQFAWLGLKPVPLDGRVSGLGRWMAGHAGLRWQCEGILVVGERRGHGVFGQVPGAWSRVAAA